MEAAIQESSSKPESTAAITSEAMNDFIDDQPGTQIEFQHLPFARYPLILRYPRLSLDYAKMWVKKILTIPISLNNTLNYFKISITPFSIKRGNFFYIMELQIIMLKVF